MVLEILTSRNREFYVEKGTLSTKTDGKHIFLFENIFHYTKKIIKIFKKMNQDRRSNENGNRKDIGREAVAPGLFHFSQSYFSCIFG